MRVFRDPVQVEGRTDQGQMTEGLWGITQLLSTAGDLFREHHQMIREAEHVLKQVYSPWQVLGLVDTGSCHCLYQPESAHAEGTFATTDAYTSC
jgi:hypothetical protein